MPPEVMKTLQPVKLGDSENLLVGQKVRSRRVGGGVQGREQSGRRR